MFTNSANVDGFFFGADIYGFFAQLFVGFVFFCFYLKCRYTKMQMPIIIAPHLNLITFRKY